MPKFEEQKINPAENPREAYEKTEEDETSLRARIGDAKTADEIMEIAQKLKATEGTKSELVGAAQEEALKEEGERKMYDEAKAEDAERTMHDEAKAEDTERTAAEESEKLDADLENLRGQIAGKNVDQIMEIAAKMKEVEAKINEIGTAKTVEEAKAQTEKDKQEYDKVLEEIKGGKEKIEDNPKFQQLKIAYREMNGPGSHNPEVRKRFAELSNEIALKLNSTSDIKEAHFYLTNKDGFIVDKKWDELSRQEVESATSEEEMQRAMQNIRPGGYAEPIRIREIAIEKFPSLRGPRGY